MIVPRKLLSRRRALWLVCALSLSVPAALFAPPPAWWALRGATNSAQADDYAVANIGQLKHFASKAALELAQLTGGAAAVPEITAMIAEWNAPPVAGVVRDDYAALTLGQLKYVAKPFHLRLQQAGFTTGFPWATDSPSADDLALANIGQLKTVFNFDLDRDSDGDSDGDGYSDSYELFLARINAGTPDADILFTLGLWGGPIGGSAPAGIARVSGESFAPASSFILVTDPTLAPVISLTTTREDAVFKLIWHKSFNANILGYRVQHSSDGETWNTIGNVGADTLKYPVSEGSYGVRDYYRIIAIMPHGDINPSNVKIVSPWFDPRITVNEQYEDGDEESVTEWLRYGPYCIGWFEVYEGPPCWNWSVGASRMASTYSISANGPLSTFKWAEIERVNSGRMEDPNRPCNCIEVGESEWQLHKLCFASEGLEGACDPETPGEPCNFPWYGVIRLPDFIVQDVRLNDLYHDDGGRLLFTSIAEDVEESEGVMISDDEYAAMALQSWEHVGAKDDFNVSGFTLTWDSDRFQVWIRDEELESGDYIPQLGPEMSFAQDELPLRIKVRPGTNPEASVTVTMVADMGLPIEARTDKVKVTYKPKVKPGLLTVPTDEMSGPRYRKVSITGRPMPDGKPQAEPESDVEPEETFIDAMTLGLNHSTTDIHVSIAGADLALAVRRNTSPEIWNMRSGLRPHERPDHPFGAGWSSNLGAHVELAPGAANEPSYAYVVDESGSRHKFLYYSESAANTYRLKFISLPGGRHDAVGCQNRMVDEGGGILVFKSRFGSEIVFERPWAYGVMDRFINDDRERGGGIRRYYTYYRVQSMRDRTGNTLNYQYVGNPSLVPTRISRAGVPGQAIEIIQDSNGVVTEVRDPNGNITRYSYVQMHYQSAGLQHGVTVLQSVSPPGGGTTSYTYDLAVETDRRVQDDAEAIPQQMLHCDVRTIKDPRQKTYTFSYAFDLTKFDADIKGRYFPKLGCPRNVVQVDFPGGKSKFANKSLLKLGWTRVAGAKATFGEDWKRETEVTDAEGSLIKYRFTDPKTFLLENIETLYGERTKIPRMISYETMTIDYGVIKEQPCREEFRFDLNAGLALSSIKDISGNVTSYGHSDTWTPPPEHLRIFGNNPYGRTHAEPTSESRGGVNTSFTYENDPSVKSYRLLKTSTDGAGRMTYYEFDDLGRRNRELIFDAGGSVRQETQFRYDSNLAPGVVTERRILANTLEDPSVTTDRVTASEIGTSGANAGRITAKIVGDFSRTQYTYDPCGNKLSATDPNGFRTGFTYDPGHRLIRIAYPGGGLKTFSYDARGNKSSETDENGRVTQLIYDDLNRLVETRRVGGGASGDLVTRFEYNKLGLRTALVDPNLNRTQATYDALGRPDVTTGPLNGAVQYFYGVNSGGSAFDVSGFKPTKTIDPRGYQTLVTYDALYRPISREVQYQLSPALFAATHYVYDNAGNVLSETDPLGVITTKSYDALNRVTSVTAASGTPDSASQSFFYTATGLQYRVVDERGFATETEFDSMGNPVFVHLPDGSFTQAYYDAAGNVTWRIDALGRATNFAYDSRNRKIRERHPSITDEVTGVISSPTVGFWYDAVGNLISTKDPRGNATLKGYDFANRLTSIVDPGGGATFNKYDRAGNVTQVTDPDGNVTINTYDQLNRLLTTRDALGQVVTCQYDLSGNRTALVDGKNQRTEFTYDGLNRILTMRDAAGTVSAFSYNALNKARRTDSRGVTDYTYDHRHRLKTISYPTRPADNCTYSYDPAGNLLAVDQTGASRDVAYTYEVMNRVETESSGGLVHQYIYDACGNRTQTIYGGTGRTLDCSYDAGNRLQTLAERVPGYLARTTTYGYDVAGNTTRKTLPNGDKVGTTYDAMNRATSMEGRTVPNLQNPQGALLYRYQTSYDAVGNVKSIAESGAGELSARNLAMQYDPTHRLVSEVATEVPAVGQPVVTTTTYAFDAAGNRVAKTWRTGASDPATTTYGYNALNQLTVLSSPASTETFTYDLDGNRLKRTVNPASGSSTWDDYTYDQENRLVQLIQGSSLTAPGTLHQYIYDYRTRRVERVESLVATRVIFSGGTSVQEYSGASVTPAVEYVRGSDFGGGVGGILYSMRDATPSFTHYDGRGDVTAKTDGIGALTYQASYEAYGKRTRERGSTPDRQKANTKEEDPTGLLNEGMRYRDLATGTFLTRDPAGFVDGPNLYAYVRQNPWSKFDPEGLYSWSEFRQDADAFAGGTLQGFGEANGGSTSNRPQQAPGTYRVGLAVGHALGLAQGAGEVTGGSAMVGTGAALATGGAAATVGTGGAAAPVGAPAVAGGVALATGGAALATHGTLVAGNSFGLLLKDANDALSDKGNPGGKTAKETTEETQKNVDGETGNAGMQDGYDPDDLKGLTVKEGKEQGRDWRVEKLETHEFDPKQPSHVRGWLKNERRRTEQGRQDGARNPPGYEQAHKPGKPAREGYDYNSSDLNLKSNNDLATKHGL